MIHIVNCCHSSDHLELRIRKQIYLPDCVFFCSEDPTKLLLAGLRRMDSPSSTNFKEQTVLDLSPLLRVPPRVVLMPLPLRVHLVSTSLARVLRNLSYENNKMYAICDLL